MCGKKEETIKLLVVMNEKEIYVKEGKGRKSFIGFF
jgi:hypothetical protein